MTDKQTNSIVINVAHSVPSCATEADYHRCWSDHVSGIADWVEMAVRGGELADRLAWVFVAGYQSAIRHTFSRHEFSDWAAFAVSEDRKGEPPLPGVVSSQQAEQNSVSGYKTWVACSETMQHLVIKADRGAAARYYQIPRQASGLQLSQKGGSFLGEMSQGVAQLENVQVGEPLDASAVALFGLRESLYIYMAFCAFAANHGPHAQGQPSPQPSLQADAQQALDALRPLVVDLPADQAELDALKQADKLVQALLTNLRDDADFVANYGAAWEKDQRLIAMYSPGIQRRQLN